MGEEEEESLSSLLISQLAAGLMVRVGCIAFAFSAAHSSFFLCAMNTFQKIFESAVYS